MIERPDPDALLAGPLGQWLTSQQDARVAAKAKARERRRLGFIAAAVLSVVYLIFSRFDFEGAVWTAAVVSVLGGVWGEMAKSELVKAVKGQINQAIAQALDLEYAAEPAIGDEWRRARDFGLTPKYERVNFEDGWSGRIGELPFQLYEAHCEERRKNDDRDWSTVFRGVVMSVGFTRRFHGTTLIERDGLRKTWFGGEKEEITLEGIRLQRCDMVDPTFEARFTVWGDDAMEARYLVHPEYIERLTAVEKAFCGSNIRALFCGGNLLILLETQNLFESGGIDASDDRARLARTIDQFGELADLARRLNEAPRGNFMPASAP